MLEPIRLQLDCLGQSWFTVPGHTGAAWGTGALRLQRWPGALCRCASWGCAVCFKGHRKCPLGFR